jgi:hypothetical protein
MSDEHGESGVSAKKGRPPRASGDRRRKRITGAKRVGRAALLRGVGARELDAAVEM